MDKYEYKLKLEQMKTLASEGDYKTAADIADTVNWRKVRNVNSLCKVADVYENVGRLEDSRDLLLLAYDRSPIGRMIIYRLAMVAIRMNSMEEADEYYQEFVDIAPHDNLKYILRYKIHKAQGKDITVQIEDLEDLKEQEYTEEWAYELAYLYSKAGMDDRCVEACDELILWFGDGRFVEKALRLKMKYQPLSQQQQKKYKELQSYTDDIVEVRPDAILEEEEKPKTDEGSLESVKNTLLEHLYQESVSNLPTEPSIEIPDLLEEDNIDEIKNLQAELAKDMEQIMEATTEESLNIDLFEKAKKESEKTQQKEKQQEESKTNGQGTTIEDVLKEWEKTKRQAEEALRAAEQKRLQAAKEMALQEAEDIMDQLADVIPKLDAQKLHHKLQDTENMTAEEAGNLVAGMNEMLQEEIDKLNQQEEEVPQDISQEVSQEEPDRPEPEEVYEPEPDRLEPEEVYEPEPEPEVQEPEVEEANEPEAFHGIEDFNDVEDFNDMEDFSEEEVPDGKEPELEIPEVELPTELNIPSIEVPELDLPEIDLSELDLSGLDMIRKAVEEDLEKVNRTQDLKGKEPEQEEKRANAEQAEPESTEDEEVILYEDDSVSEPTVRMPDLNTILRKNKEAIKQQSSFFHLDKEDDAEYYTPESLVEAEPEAKPETDREEETFAKAQEALAQAVLEAEMQEVEPLEALEMEAAKDFTKTTDHIGKSVQEENFRKFVEERTGKSRKMTRLPKDIRGIFSYFIPVTGMEAQLCSTLQGVIKSRGKRKDSTTGNIIIQGIRGSGKTVLAADIIKALQKQTGNTSGRVGKIEASALNQKDIPAILKKVAGGYLIIERAGDLSRETATRLSLIMEGDTNGLVIIMEDTKAGIVKALGRDASFSKKFTEKVEIPYFTSDELVAFGRAYAKDMGYRIDEMGILALYNRISSIQKLDHATTLTEIKEIVDDAIVQSEKGGLKKILGMFTARKNNDDDYIPLREKDFE